MLDQTETHLHRVFEGRFRLKEITIIYPCNLFSTAQYHLDILGQPLQPLHHLLTLIGFTDLDKSVYQTLQMILNLSVILERCS